MAYVRVIYSMRVCQLHHLSRACLNTVLMPASHQTSGKLLESVQRSKKDERKTLHDTEYYLSSGYQVNQWNSASQVISLITWSREIYLITDNGLIGRESQQKSF